MSRVDASVLEGLRPFQQATARHVWDALERPGGTQRFLVADEVGLGKTRIAAALVRQVAADRPGRATVVVYFGPNAEVVRQNMRVLRRDEHADDALERLTLLPLAGRELTQRRLHILGFTQGTSLSPVKRGSGRGPERALLLELVRPAWRIHASDSAVDVFRVTMDPGNFRDALRDVSRKTVHAGVAQRFARELHKAPALRLTFDQLRAEPVHDRNWRHAQRAFIGELRLLLARTVLRTLDPQLVVFDEFQKYSEILTAAETIGSLEHTITQGRVLLLSATPYRMRADEADTGMSVELATLLRFLLDDRRVAEDALGELEELRRAFRQLRPMKHPDYAKSRNRVSAAKRGVEDRLRPVMCRSQRPRLKTPTEALPIIPEAPDLLAYLAFQRTVDIAARHVNLQHRSTIEYWKSAPYLMAFMRGYRVKEAIDDAWEKPGTRRAMSRELRRAEGAAFPIAAVERYRKVPSVNARLRVVADGALNSDQWRALWVPPSLAPYALEGPFARAAERGTTKTLVFSGWRVVPTSVAALLGYEAERRAAGRRDNSVRARRTRVSAQLLSPQYDARRGLRRASAVSLAYPSVVLAETVTPYASPEDGRLPTARRVLAEAKRRLRTRVEQLRCYESSNRDDADWYWITPLLLDLEAGVDVIRLVQDRRGLRDAWRTTDDKGRTSHAMSELLLRARRLLKHPHSLGRQPKGLITVLAQLAVAGPGVVAYRALDGIADDDSTRIAAARMGWGLRGLLGRADAVLAVRSALKGRTIRDDDGYWRQALEYCVMGGLQGVLDEYIHLLIGEQVDPTGKQAKVVDRVSKSFTRATDLSPLAIAVDGRGGDRQAATQARTQRRLTSRFAVAFGASRTENDASVHPETVRQAFNSPFWPWVLVTTSVGQEGLDFHRYCHSLVHWNIPASPVELEQREGRVLRFLGHAVRRNIADAHGAVGRAATGNGQWSSMIIEAARLRHDRLGFAPEWHYSDDGFNVRRTALVYAYSRDQERLERIQLARIYYRLVLGQPDPAELVEVLMETIPPAEAEEHVRSLALDLSPWNDP